MSAYLKLLSYVKHDIPIENVITHKHMQVQFRNEEQQKNPKHNQKIIDIIPIIRKKAPAVACFKYLKKLSFNFPSPSIISKRAST